jgi:hypothetical protein
VVYRAAVHHITKQTIAQIYHTSSSGEERPAEARNWHKEYFSVEKDSTNGYPVDNCLDSEMRDIFRFLCPILDPLRPNRVHIYRFNQVYLSLWKKVKVNWTRNLYWSMYNGAHQVGVSPQSYLSPCLFHFYNQNNALTWNEKADYMAAMANVQEQLAQGKTLDPAAPELDHLNQTELPLQLVDRGYMIGTRGPSAQRMKYQPSGEGTSRQGGS